MPATLTKTKDAPLGSGSLLYRFEARLETRAVIGLTPRGLRQDAWFGGVVTAGELAGARVEGMDYFLLRPDGTGVIDGRLAMLDGERVVHGRPQGYVLLPEGVEPPPLEAVVAPGFEWPDLPLAIQEFTLFETVVPEWDHLNRTAAPGSGTVNMATGELVVEARMP